MLLLKFFATKLFIPGPIKDEWNSKIFIIHFFFVEFLFVVVKIESWL